jgi:hypothetical protein
MEDKVRDAELTNRLQDKNINEVINKAVAERLKDLEMATQSKLKQQPLGKVTPATKEIWQRGDRAIATGAGGALLGGIVAQLPGAIAGAVFGTLYGLFVVPKKTRRAES